MSRNSLNAKIRRLATLVFAVAPLILGSTVYSFITPVQAQSACALKSKGDANCDGHIDLLDFEAFRREYLLFTAGNLNISQATANFNNDNSIDLLDFEIFRVNYLNAITQTVTPTISVSKTPTATGAPSPTPTHDHNPTPTGPTPTGPTSNQAPYDWGPFDPRQIPIELQGWWTHVPDNGKSFGHVHAMCKWPVGQKVSGTLTSNCRITMHDNPSTLQALVFHLAPGIVIKSIPLGDKKCPYDGVTHTNCSWDVPVSLDTGSWGSGWKHLRIRATMQTADKKKWTTSSEVPMIVGSPDGGGEFPSCINGCVIGKSWYEALDYQSSRLANIPLTPIKGIHVFQASTFKGAAQELEVTLDKSHDIPATGPWPMEHATTGSQVLDIKNPAEKKFYDVSIDTTKLANGWHSIAARSVGADGLNDTVCSFCDPGLNVQTGVTKAWFYVQN